MNTDLLIKYIEGNATEQEKILITGWLDADSANMREFLALRKLQDIIIWQLEPVTNFNQNQKEKHLTLSWKRVALETLKIAAVFLVAFLGFRYFTPKQVTTDPVVMQTLHVPAGQRAELTLTDGTKVWLNAKTTLTFPNKFSDQNRLVQLDGEGFFDVTSNKEKPFIVKTHKYDVQVWGTKFNLMAYSGKGIFETSLLEGSVEVLNSGTTKGTIIKPDQRIYEDNNRLVTAPITHMNHFLWKDGIISFDDESFPQMVRKLELYFDLKVEVKNDRFQKYKCTGKFRTKDGVDHILKVLQLNNKFKFTIDDKLNSIVIE